MKKITLTLFIAMQLIAISALHAQIKIKRYAQLNWGWTKNAIMFGQKKISTNSRDSLLSPFKSASLTKKMLTPPKFENYAQALNYMTDLGWRLETTIPAGGDQGLVSLCFIFSHDFDREDLTELGIDPSGADNK